jgi:hypothetical protein
MKGISGLLIATVLLVLMGAGLARLGFLERDMAQAQANVTMQNYDGVEETFATAEKYYEYGSHLPWVGNGPVNEVRARRASMHYWQKAYGEVIPQQTDPVGAVAADNTALQLIVANAVYRTGQAQSKDKATTMQALDAGINAYQAVLKNTARQDDAAFNYEYLIRLRDDVDKGKRKPGPGDLVMKGPDGASGAPPTLDSTMSDFKIYIPLDSQERQDQGVAGKAAGIKRKG